jgi:hypothetical protein
VHDLIEAHHVDRSVRAAMPLFRITYDGTESRKSLRK